jgi:rusticyanin
MIRSHIKTMAAAAAVAATGLAAAGAITACGSNGHPASTATAAASAPAGTQASAQYSYSYYRSMMGRYFGGSMMGGGSYGWMMSPAGYRWMTGVAGVPGWMRGGQFSAFMMGGGTDMGKLMGRLWADAPGPRVSPAEAAGLGSKIPAGAQVNPAARTITFTTASVRFTAVASPAGGPEETFRVAGLVNPKISVPAGARVSIQVVNADPDTAHGLVVTTSGAASSWMPMMTSRAAFTGSALWFLGDPTATGMHSGTLTFTASAPGSYHYLCPVPGHAQKGMTGTFIVTRTR